MVSTHYLEKYLSQSFYLPYADWSWWGHDPFLILDSLGFRSRTLVKLYTWFLLIILRTIYHLAFIFHMLSGLDIDITHIDIGVIRSKVKVRRITFVKSWFLIILRTVYHRGFIFHMFIGLSEGLTAIFCVLKVKSLGQKSCFCKKIVFRSFC